MRSAQFWLAPEEANCVIKSVTEQISALFVADRKQERTMASNWGLRLNNRASSSQTDTWTDSDDKMETSNVVVAQPQHQPHLRVQLAGEKFAPLNLEILVVVVVANASSCFASCGRTSKTISSSSSKSRRGLGGVKPRGSNGGASIRQEQQLVSCLLLLLLLLSLLTLDYQAAAATLSSSSSVVTITTASEAKQSSSAVEANDIEDKSGNLQVLVESICVDPASCKHLIGNNFTFNDNDDHDDDASANDDHHHGSLSVKVEVATSSPVPADYPLARAFYSVEATSAKLLQEPEAVKAVVSRIRRQLHDVCQPAALQQSNGGSGASGVSAASSTNAIASGDGEKCSEDRRQSEELIELLAQFYAHTKLIQDRLVLKSLLERKPQTYNINVRGQDQSATAAEAVDENENDDDDLQKDPISEEEKVSRGKMKVEFGADDETLLKWLKQRQSNYSSLQNTTIELLKEEPNRTIIVCEDGPKVLVLPDKRDILHCYTSDQWISKLWSDIEKSVTLAHYPIIILNILIFLFGTTGNIFVCLSVYRNHQLRNVTNYFIVNLAFADFLVILICLPATVVWDLSLTWFFGTIPCKLIMFLQDVSISVSVLTLTAISIDRYYAICYPLSFKSNLSQAKRMIALIWMVSLLIMAPDLIYLRARESEELNEAGLETVLYSDCNYDWSHECSRVFQFVKTILLYLLPFILMFVAHFKILQTLKVAASASLPLSASYQSATGEQAPKQTSNGRRHLQTSSSLHVSRHPSAIQQQQSAPSGAPTTTRLQMESACPLSLSLPWPGSRLAVDPPDPFMDEDASSQSAGSAEPNKARHSTTTGLWARSTDNNNNNPKSSNGLCSNVRTSIGRLMGGRIIRAASTTTTNNRELMQKLAEGRVVMENGHVRKPISRSPPPPPSTRPAVGGQQTTQLNAQSCDLLTRETSLMESRSNKEHQQCKQQQQQQQQTLLLKRSSSSVSTSGDNKQRQQQQQQQLIVTMHNKSKLESRRSAAKMLMTIVVLFGICYLPVHLINFLRQFIENIPQTDVTSTISMLAHCICYLNSAINPIIYNHMNSIFRAEFKKFLSCFCWLPKRSAPTATGGSGASTTNRPTTVNQPATTYVSLDLVSQSTAGSPLEAGETKLSANADC